MKFVVHPGRTARSGDRLSPPATRFRDDTLVRYFVPVRRGIALVIALLSLSVFGFLIWAAAAALQSMMDWVRFLLAGH